MKLAPGDRVVNLHIRKVGHVTKIDTTLGLVYIRTRELPADQNAFLASEVLDHWEVEAL